MGEFAAKYRPEIDLDEFERRLRAAAPAPQGQTAPSQAAASAIPDPLAELARLVGGDPNRRSDDPFEALFRAQAAVREIRDAPAPIEPPAAPRDPYFGQQAPQNQFAQHPDPYALLSSPQGGARANQMRQEPAFEDPYADFYGQPQAQDEAASYGEAEPKWADEAAPAPTEYWNERFDDPAAAVVAPARKRKVAFGMAAVLVAGVLGIGGTLALRSKSGGDVVTINANPEPAKVKPDVADGGNGGSASTLFDRKTDSGAARVVSNSEQPADLNAAVKAARVVGPADGVPTPPAPSGAAPAQPASDSVFPAPKKVKTISVRPDGSLINGETRQPAGSMAMGLPPAAAGGAPLTVRSVPLSPTTKSTDRASSTSTTQAALQAPARPRPAAAAPVQTAAAHPAAGSHAAAAPAGASPGSWAVQLSSSTSESEARASVSALGAKYSSALQGRRPSAISGQSGDHLVFRVRVVNLSEDGAKSMCMAIKGQGGTCFATKN